MDSNVQDKIFDFAYYEALNDATLQGAYLGSKEDVRKIDAVKDIVKKYVDKIINGKEEYSFDDTVKEIEIELENHNIITRKKDEDADLRYIFGFGNIQKLINMTVKYIFVGCYSNNTLRESFAKCHCPMDNEMIKIVYREYNKLADKEEELLITQRKGDKKYFGISNICWSKIDFEITDDKTSKAIYDNFQEMVKRLCEEKESVLPIEYDFWKHGTERDCPMQ